MVVSHQKRGSGSANGRSVPGGSHRRREDRRRSRYRLQQAKSAETQVTWTRGLTRVNDRRVTNWRKHQESTNARAHQGPFSTRELTSGQLEQLRRLNTTSRENDLRVCVLEQRRVRSAPLTRDRIPSEAAYRGQNRSLVARRDEADAVRDDETRETL
jgi:hypothetical protein